jgi:hypothetical protein
MQYLFRYTVKMKLVTFNYKLTCAEETVLDHAQEFPTQLITAVLFPLDFYTNLILTYFPYVF